MSEDLSKGTREEVSKLFGATKDGVKCAGEGTNEPLSMGSGGRRNLICIIRSEDNVEYEITVKNIENLKRPSDDSFENWILDKDWEGSVAPGGEGTDAVVAVLDIPKEVSSTSLKFTIESTNLQTLVKKTHTAYVAMDRAADAAMR